jgi:arabinogalactan endo-1,4-beta-galactosidase
LPTDSISESELNYSINPLRNLLDEIIFDVDQSSILKEFGHRKYDIVDQATNLFAVLRTSTINNLRMGFFNYTAR